MDCFLPLHSHGYEINTQTCGVYMVPQALLLFVELPTQNVVLYKHFKDHQWTTEIYSFAIQQSPIPEDPQGFVDMPHRAFFR